MAPNILKAVTTALASNQDLSGRPLIDQERAWLQTGLTHLDQLDRENTQTTLVPGHGLLAHDSQYLDLLVDTIRTVSVQMKAFVAQGLSKEAAFEKIDVSGVERRFTHGEPFLTNRFHDYVTSGGLLQAAYALEMGKGPEEAF